MNRIYKIAAIPVCVFLFTAEQCGEGGETSRQENLLNTRKNQIISDFESGFLNESSLFEHEKAAKQKLADVADYLKILTDSSLQQPFREKAAEMIRNCFVSDETEIELSFANGEPVRTMKIGLLIGQALHNQLPMYENKFDSVKVKTSFRRNQEESYSATLGFYQVPDNLSLAGANGNLYYCQVPVFIGKETKVFGTDTLSVWGMHFGKMEFQFH